MWTSQQSPESSTGCEPHSKVLRFFLFYLISKRKKEHFSCLKFWMDYSARFLGGKTELCSHNASVRIADKQRWMQKMTYNNGKSEKLLRMLISSSCITVGKNLYNASFNLCSISVALTYFYNSLCYINL